MSRRFPDGFLWGTSTSSFQVEMGLGKVADNSDWWVWVHDSENIRRGNASGIFPEDGPGFWETYPEDLRRVREGLGNNAFRLSVDWTRVFPHSTKSISVKKRYDKYGNLIDVEIDEETILSLGDLADQNVVNHYRVIFAEANRLGIKVFLTLYHWPLPLWLHDPVACRDNLESTTLRGWLEEDTLVEYAKYAAYSAYVFGDLIDLYATINEAPIVSKYGYLHERVHFPPGQNNVELFLRVFRNLSIAHGLGYSQIKKWDNVAAWGGEPASVGVVTVLEQYDPVDPSNADDVCVADFNNYLWNCWNLNAVIYGDYDMNLDMVISEEEHHPELVKGCDFIGADYYLRERVKYAEKNDPRFSFEFVASEGLKSDTGWEIYPEGLGNVLRSTFAKYDLPIYVTENGVADAGDKLRVDYLRKHIDQVYSAIMDGVDIRGYFYWSLLDNYSWFSGYRSRFGLYSVDMKTKERKETSGVKAYREIAEGT